MRTIAVEVFKFDELDENAQETVLNKFREWNAGDPAWGDEWRESLEVFTARLGITVKDWSVSTWGNSYINWEWDNSDWWYLDEDPADTMTGLRLRTWLINNWLPEFRQGKYYSKTTGVNPFQYIHRHSKCQFTYDNCPLTGYCGDMDLIDPILKFVANPHEHASLRDIINDCLWGWVYGWQRDMEDQESDEYIREQIEANDYEFYADGSMA